jgi:undecaprenyl-diphosphatase
MTTFQTVIYALTYGLTQCIPIGAQTHTAFVSYLTGWQPPSEEFLGALQWTSFAALFLYFRHDWASMISSLLQVLLFRKRPMSLDEKLPLFLAATAFPVLCTFYYLDYQKIAFPLIFTAISFASLGATLWIFDFLSKKNKSMCDWSWFDATWVGIAQASCVVPGGDPVSCTLMGAFFFNHRRDAALKYAYLSTTPLLLIQSLHQHLTWSAIQSTSDLSLLSFIAGILIAFFTGLLSLGAIFKQIQENGIGKYSVYRFVLTLAICASYWLKT